MRQVPTNMGLNGDALNDSKHELNGDTPSPIKRR